MIITYGSVCSGIEAATCAWHPLGWKAEWFAEIEPFPSAVLAHRYPETPNLGDMTLLAAQVLAGTISAPDVLVGGTPCQAFSVAGMRQGMLDPRGALTIKYVELADAIDHVRKSRGEDECIATWENVPGVLSDKGNAFGCFLGALVGESDALQPSGGKWTDAGCVYGPKRSAAWRVLDAQYFGLAQRRRRVFVVASARAGFDPAAVLFESEGVRRDTAPRRGEGENPTGTIAGGARKHGGYSTDDIPLTAGSLRAQSQSSHREDSETFIPVAVFGGNNTSGSIDVAPARNACASASGRMDFESEAFVVHGTQDPCVSDKAFSLGRNSGQENAVLAFSCKDYGNDVTNDLSPTLRAMGHGDSHANAGGQVAVALIQNATRGKDQNGLGVVGGEEPMYTLDQASQHAVCVTGDITHTLKADGFDGSEDGTGRGQPIVAVTQTANNFVCEGCGITISTSWGWGEWCDSCGHKHKETATAQPIVAAFHENQRAELTLSDTAGTVKCAGGKPGQGYPAAMVGSAVRRLTPRECERLQGFEDDYSLIPWRTWQEAARKGTSYEGLLLERGMHLRGPSIEECPDGPRYKAIGNSRAVPVVRWIGRRIQRELERAV